MNNMQSSIPQTKVAIITVTYNSANFIKEYLTSVASFLRGTEHRLILVDNQSQDSNLAIISSFIEQNHLENQIEVLPLAENVGFGRGCNSGAEAAQEYQPSHLWFLNPDTTLLDDSGSELLALFDTQKDVDFAGSILIDEKSTSRAGAFRFPTLMNVFISTMRLGFLDKIFKKYTTAIPIQNKPYTADWLTGASFMVKSSCFRQLQGFDPQYFLYFEEVDLFYRAKKAGFSVWACPASKVFHISGASTGINTKNSAPKRQPQYWFESRRYFYTSNFGKWYFAIIDSVFLICFGFTKIRCKLQGKQHISPPHLASDTFRHSNVAKWLGITPKN